MSASPEERKPWKPNAKHQLAASLLAEDVRTDEEIAAEVGIGRTTLSRWKTEEQFQSLIASYVAGIKAKILSEGIARVENRVKAQNHRHDLLEQVMAARAVEHAAIPGGSTGLLVRQVKFVKVFELLNAVQAQINAGNITEDDLTETDFIATKQTRAVEEYAVDTGLLAELRQIENITAIELGQRIEKKELSGSVELVEQAARTLDAKLLSPMAPDPTTGVSGDSDPG